MRTLRFVLLAALLASPTDARATSPCAVPIARTTEPITIDGVLDEGAWQTVAPVTEFLQSNPAPGGPPPGTTEIRFLQDDRMLYVSARITDADYDVRARISPRESINEDDQIGVYLDTHSDGRQGFIFYFNALGIQQDIRMSDDRWNWQWDTVLHSRGTLTEDGYNVEIAIPFRSLRFPEGGDAQDWGVILTRKIPALGTKYSHPPLERDHPRFFTQACTLQGVQPPRRGAGAEIMPVLAVRQSGSREDDSGPFEWSGTNPWLEFLRPGVDVRVGLSPDTGIAATLLPDFSQVEGDATQIELNQRFALYYPEQRSFFLDGVDAFQDPQNTLYTRSIIDPIYGVKVSGREGTWSVGALNALDASPSGSFHEYGTPGFSDEALEDAMAENTFARLSHTTTDGGSLGITAADKWILGSEGARNTVAGADANILLADRLTASANLSSSVVVSPEFDPMIGVMGSANLRQAGGIGTGWRLGAGGSSPDYRREMGYLPQSGNAWASGAIDHTFLPEATGFDSASVWLAASANNAMDGDLKTGASLGTSLDMVRNHSAGANLSVGTTRVSDIQIPWARVNAHYSGIWSAKARGNVSVSYGRELDYDLLVPAMGLRASLWGQWRPTTATRFDLSAGYQHLVPEGEPAETAASARLRATWQVRRQLGFRLISEYVTSNSDDEDSLDLSALVTWLKSPGTEAYLGATQALVMDGDVALLEQVYFFKISWLFRP